MSHDQIHSHSSAPKSSAGCCLFTTKQLTPSSSGTMILVLLLILVLVLVKVLVVNLVLVQVLILVPVLVLILVLVLNPTSFYSSLWLPRRTNQK